ncbi:MAG: hypothetical protein ABIK43_01795 [candidate division WOR-3 bacterium]
MPDTSEHSEDLLRPPSGFRWQLDRAIQTNGYLRVFFSGLLLVYSVFGPAALLRFPTSAGGIGFDSASRFYAYRPTLYSIAFIAIFIVLGALARRSFELFETALVLDTTERTSITEREKYLRLLMPSPLPFTLSGQRIVDLSILVILLCAYSFWVLFLAATVPPGMSCHGVAAVVIGSYGLFAAMITTGIVWSSAATRIRRLRRSSQPVKPEPVRPVTVQD